MRVTAVLRAYVHVCLYPMCIITSYSLLVGAPPPVVFRVVGNPTGSLLVRLSTRAYLAENSTRIFQLSWFNSCWVVSHCLINGVESPPLWSPKVARMSPIQGK